MKAPEGQGCRIDEGEGRKALRGFLCLGTLHFLPLVSPQLCPRGLASVTLKPWGTALSFELEFYYLSTTLFLFLLYNIYYLIYFLSLQFFSIFKFYFINVIRTIFLKKHHPKLYQVSI